MAKRELFERIKIELEGCRGWLYEDKPITEQDIVMPFLEKLKTRLAEMAREVDRDTMVGLIMAINEINLLSDEFQKEETNA